MSSLGEQQQFPVLLPFGTNAFNPFAINPLDNQLYTPVTNLGSIPPNLIPPFSMPVPTGSIFSEPSQEESSPETDKPESNKRIKASSKALAQKQRGHYKCSKCGTFKKGHHCNEPQSNTEIERLALRVKELEEEKVISDKTLAEYTKQITDLMQANMVLAQKCSEMEKQFFIDHNMINQIHAPVMYQNNFPNFFNNLNYIQAPVNRTSKTAAPEL